MSLRRAVLVVAGIALLAVPVAAHGNYVSADPQVSTDGTVRIEFGVLVTDGFVVLHADENGTPGQVVGSRAFEQYIHADLEVSIDQAYWANRSGTVDLWAVMHRDANSNGRFDPGEDPPLRSASGDTVVADRFAVRKAGTGPFNVMAERDQGQETDRNRVTLRTVRLGTDGYVVLRADVDGAPGRVVGQKALGSGEHHGVNVTIDQSFYEHRPEAFALWAVVHTSDGDGQFDATADAAVPVGDSRVMTRFVVHRTDSIEHTPTPRATATPAGTATPSGHDDHTHTAATPTAGGHDEHDHTHTGSGHQTATGGTHDHESAHTAAGEDIGTPGQPGFGLLVALVGLLVAALAATRRR